MRYKLDEFALFNIQLNNFYNHARNKLQKVINALYTHHDKTQIIYHDEDQHFQQV